MHLNLICFKVLKIATGLSPIYIMEFTGSGKKMTSLA